MTMSGNTPSLGADERATYLLDAQNKAIQLFDEIERDLLRAGVGEKQLSEEIYELAKRHGVRTHWHKRVVRSGPNTLKPFADNPPDRIIQPDDILYVDLGPVFEAWEADFGRTFVLGDDPHKKQLRDSLEPVWNTVKSHYVKNPDMTGEELYEIACDVAKQAGWDFGAEIAGHIVGSFPHERIPKDKISLYITRGNNRPMSTPGKDGKRHHWILEVHLHDRVRQHGAFFEKLLTVG
ncbi:peptidase M24, structural domain-containing protein [Aspergillus alliaceus]|uniref:Peptidase M24, structural domain-containing protein n=1 Tax=Petromyces alliaceus TaxID=209559 RepID=A0A5N7CSW6_PETAA|nr:peptidase M24, structural domain-containing protein [Aspergillus alliaceus]KAB8233682.1 peptidase M24, structural domain-containing protein [Aspergillus alliaceus]KAE8396663.1 peptidase M24, structural domain-containing protein [Aspergillus alliaceus]